MAGNQPGNGSTTPFQPSGGKAPPLGYVGAMKVSEGGAVAPPGMQQTGGKAAPLPYVAAMKLPQQGSTRINDQTSGSAVSGGLLPQQGMTSPGSIRAAQQGAGSIGNSALPFRITNQGR